MPEMAIRPTNQMRGANQIELGSLNPRADPDPRSRPRDQQGNAAQQVENSVQVE